jgi:hypothetical protein
MANRSSAIAPVANHCTGFGQAQPTQPLNARSSCPVRPGPSIRANTRKIHSGDRESDAIDAAGLAQARERFALLGCESRSRRVIVGQPYSRARAAFSRRGADQRGTGRGYHPRRREGRSLHIILVGADAHKIDERVRQSPEGAYDIGFFDEFARGSPSVPRSRTPNCASRVDHPPIRVRCEYMRAGNAAALL